VHGGRGSPWLLAIRRWFLPIGTCVNECHAFVPLVSV
jgi:hypothetical protein